MSVRRHLSCAALVLLAALSATPLRSRAAEGATPPPPPPPTAQALWPRTASPAALTDPKTEAYITSLLSKMSLEEKVGQTIQADILSITPQDLRQYPLGSILAGGNSGPDGDDRATPAQWVAFIERFRAVAMEARPGHTPIPLLFGIDAVHGHSNIGSATIFPHNVGLGAMRDPALIRRIGEVTAEEVAAVDGDWTFAPTVAVPRDRHWGRSYEGYAEDPAVVKTYSGPMTLGLQGDLVAGRSLAPGHIIGSAKHFLGDGGTVGGKDEGDARLSEAELERLHDQGYPPAIAAGILTVMTSHSSWNGVKMAGNRYLITDILKGRMGFQGFVIDDWNAHGHVDGCTNTDCPQAMNAGLDMFMAPDSWKGLFANTLAEVKAGAIPKARLDDAVRRILRVKIKGGLFDPQHSVKGHFELLGSADHRAVAREAVAQSLVLLKNNNGVLPIKASAHVLVAGDGADNIAKQCGGWTISWQGTGNQNSDFPNGQSIYGGIADAVKQGGGQVELAVDGHYKTRPDVAIVVFGEDPYAEFQGDIATFEYQPGNKTDLALLKRLKSQGIPVVSVFLSGRPLWTNPEINASDAFVAAWLPGTEGGGLADVLVRKADGSIHRDFSGKLPNSWPRRADQTALNAEDAGYDPQFAYGYGLSYLKNVAVPRLSEDPGKVIVVPNTDRYFVTGRVLAPWQLTFDGQGAVKVIDAGAQENARLAEWAGRGAGTLRVTTSGSPVDLSRQTLSDMALTLRYQVGAAPTRPVTLSVACGNGCSGAVDLTSLLAAGATSGWRTTKIKLSCFQTAGAVMSKVTSPLALTTDGTLSLTFTEISLTSNVGDAVCPVKAP